MDLAVSAIQLHEHHDTTISNTNIARTARGER